MKRYIWMCCLLMSVATIWPTQKSHAIVWAVVKQALVKVIKAMDLQVQRLQNKTIELQNTQKALENALSKLKLTEIGDWVNKQREQYSVYYGELQKVRNAIAYYRRVKEIIQAQVQLVDEYKRAFALFKKDKHFSPRELAYMAEVYEGIFAKSLESIDQLLLVVSSLATQMTDAKRLEIINAAGNSIDENRRDLQRFNQQNKLLSLQRAKDEAEAHGLKQLYGLP